MTDTDHFFLSRPDQDKLVELLNQIPGLIEDLAISITRQDRIGYNGPRVRTGSDEQPLPVNLDASEAADLLHDTLAAWVRHTCEHRTLTYDGRDDTLNLARWLKRWILALALSEGADESHDEIRHAVRQARHVTDRPRDKSRVLLGHCGQCATKEWGQPTVDKPTCRTCGEELSMDPIRQEIDATMDRLILPAKEAAVIIATRYGTSIKAKSIYDMAYRAKNPIKPVELGGGIIGFDVRTVVEDLKKRGKIA